MSSSIESHTANLTRAGLPTMEALVKRILRVFDSATPSDREAGARWYADARELAVSLAEDAGGIDKAAAVIAALSIRTRWSRNVAGAVELVRLGRIYPGVMARNAEIGRRALDVGMAALNGPKTQRFARNIAGDDESVTVDVWALRVVDVPEKSLARKGVYNAIEHAYQLAARRRGITPATMQATTWVVARNGRAQ